MRSPHSLSISVVVPKRIYQLVSLYPSVSTYNVCIWP